MKFKKVVLISMLIVPIHAFAQNSNVVDGVTVVSASEMTSDNALKKRDNLELTQMKTQGYFKTEYNNAHYLQNVKSLAPAEIKKYANSKDVYDTHLKQSISEIKLAFPYDGIHGVSPDKIIGFAATGTVVKGGWTGVKEVFEDEKLGVCSLDIESRQNVKMQIRINAERVLYTANNNPTTVQVQGDPKFGFRYSVFWISKKYKSDLDCVSKDYDPNLSDKMIVYADYIARHE